MDPSWRYGEPMDYARRALALAIWAFAVWLLLTWTVTAEQLVFGGLLAVAVGAAMAPLGEVVRPWRMANPLRVLAVLRLIVSAAGRIVVANVGLARRILAPSRPLASGMVIVPTTAHTDREIGATGLITSLIVDNQIVDVDRSQDELQYHAVAVPRGTKQEKAEHVNAPVERLLAAVDRAKRR